QIFLTMRLSRHHRAHSQIKDTGNLLGSDYGRKRQQLISDLLNSPGHHSHSYNYWADILRITEAKNRFGRNRRAC
ncbi:MAG: hypothetical protein AAF226_13005, partial [Verrucomicrobiota bacterium]